MKEFTAQNDGPISGLFAKLILTAALLALVAGAAPSQAAASQDIITLGRAEKPPREPEVILRDCMACHSLKPLSDSPDQSNAPTLHGIYGRAIASVDGYAYSSTLKERTGYWDRSTLMGFLERPDYFASGTHMGFRGIESFSERRKLIAWFIDHKYDTELATPIIERKEAQKTAELQGDPKAGKLLFRRCTSCHRETTTPGARPIAPNLQGIVGRPVANDPNFDYSTAMQARGGVWSREALNRWFLERRPTGQGSHFGFVLLDTPEKRADLIAYLATKLADENRRTSVK